MVMALAWRCERVRAMAAELVAAVKQTFVWFGLQTAIGGLPGRMWAASGTWLGVGVGSTAWGCLRAGGRRGPRGLAREC